MVCPFCSEEHPVVFREALLTMLMTVPLMLVAQMLTQAALVPLIGDRALGGDMGPGRAWVAVGLRVGPILWTGLLSMLATMLGALCCLVPGIVAVFGLSLAMPVVLLEGRSGADALRRSWRLMEIEWPRVVGMWLLALVASALLTAPLSLLLVRFASADPAALFDLTAGWRAPVLQLAHLAISLVLYPLPVIGTTLVYLHARREREGIPLAELQMQRAATGT